MQCNVFNEKLTLDFYTGPDLNERYYSLPYADIQGPSGISDLCGTVAGMVTPKGSMSTEGETLQVSVLPYRCSI